jgi:hypothetical protein
MTPPALRNDFQDMPAWRQGVFEVLDLVLDRHPGPVLAPMTLVEPAYFDDIIGRLRDRGRDVRHFALLADRQTVLRRLRERGLGHVVAFLGGGGSLRRETFAVANLDRCLDALRRPEFATHVWTDERTVPQVAEHVAASAGLPLEPDTAGALRGGLRRAWIGARHIRLR